MNDDTYPPSATDARLHERRRLMHLCPLARARAEWLTAPSARKCYRPLGCTAARVPPPDAQLPASTLERQWRSPPDASLMATRLPRRPQRPPALPGGDSAETSGDLPFLISFFPS